MLNTVSILRLSFSEVLFQRYSVDGIHREIFPCILSLMEVMRDSNQIFCKPSAAVSTSVHLLTTSVLTSFNDTV